MSDYQHVWHPARAGAAMVSMILAALWAGVAQAQTAPATIRFGQIDPPVVAQFDIGSDWPISNQRLDKVSLQCSGLAWFDGRLLAVSDKHEHALFSLPLDLDTLDPGTTAMHVVNRNEQSVLEDAESITVTRRRQGGWAVYVFTSLSNDRDALPRPNRQHLLRLIVPPGRDPSAARGVVLAGQHLRDLLGQALTSAGVAPYRTFNVDYAGSDKNTYRWGNVEGIALGPDGRNLLAGLRNPTTPTGRAILFSVAGLDEAFDQRDTARMMLRDVFTLDLAGRGVSDLCWDDLTQGYLITAARFNGPKRSDDQPFPPVYLDSAVYWWSGHKSEPPRLVFEAPDMAIEAVCRLGESPYIALASDEADFSEGRPREQSVLTIVYFALRKE